MVSALLLLVPAGLLAVAVSDPATPYWVFLVIAATAGLGGGNFASSMANITYFYPQAKQGSALGLNAAGGNIGVSSVQLVMPLVIARVRAWPPPGCSGCRSSWPPRSAPTSSWTT